MGAFFTASGHRPSSVGHRRAAYLTRLRSEHADLTLALRRLRASKPDFSPAQLDRIVSSGTAEMDALAAQSCAQFARLTQARIQAYRAHRAFQDEHGISAPARTPDILVTLLVLMICGLAEAGFTAVLMITGGKMTILEGFGYGATVAAINLAVGMLAGFLPLRYTGFKRNAPHPQPRDGAIRAVAWMAFIAALSVLTVLHFAAARVRVTGAATHIFDFSHVSFGATFADYYALGVLAIGAVGAVLAVFKGYNGFSDPTPGYAESRRAAGERIDAQGQDAFHDVQDALASVLERAGGQAEDFLEAAHEQEQAYADEAENLSRRIIAHNGLIDAACEDLQLAVQEDAARQSFIAGHAQAPEALRLEALKALALPELPESLSIPPAQTVVAHADAFTRLQGAHDQAAAAIRMAYDAFLTDVTRFDFSPQTKEARHEHARTPSVPARKTGKSANGLAHTAQR